MTYLLYSLVFDDCYRGADGRTVTSKSPFPVGTSLHVQSYIFNVDNEITSFVSSILVIFFAD